MARKRMKSVVQIAVSPFAASAACNVSYERCILPAILAGELTVHTNPRSKNCRRILIADLEKWVRETWSRQLTRKVPNNG